MKTVISAFLKYSLLEYFIKAFFFAFILILRYNIIVILNILEFIMFGIFLFLIITFCISFILFLSNSAVIFYFNKFGFSNTFKYSNPLMVHYHFYQTFKILRFCSKNNVKYSYALSKGLGQITN